MTTKDQALRAALEALILMRHNGIIDAEWDGKAIESFDAAITLCEEAMKIEPVFGKNYEQGVWSRRNLEAYLEDQGEPE